MQTKIGTLTFIKLKLILPFKFSFCRFRCSLNRLRSNIVYMNHDPDTLNTYTCRYNNVSIVNNGQLCGGDTLLFCPVSRQQSPSSIKPGFQDEIYTCFFLAICEHQLQPYTAPYTVMDRIVILC